MRDRGCIVGLCRVLLSRRRAQIICEASLDSDFVAVLPGYLSDYRNAHRITLKPFWDEEQCCGNITGTRPDKSSDPIRFDELEDLLKRAMEPGLFSEPPPQAGIQFGNFLAKPLDRL